MKLLVLLTTATLVANFVASAPEPPTDKPDASENAAVAIETPKPVFDFKNFYHGALPPTRFPPSEFIPPSAPTFASFNALNRPPNAFNHFNTFGYVPFRQGILPPISQIIPPQISQIVPPIFGNVPVPAVPSQPFPSQILPNAPKPLFNKFTFPYARPPTNLPTSFAYAFPSTYAASTPTYPLSFSLPFTSAFSFSPLSPQKQPSTTAQKESPPTSYGPPVVAPEEPQSQGPAESSAPFEPSAISYPYEAAAPEEPEPTAPHKPAQEYGPPTV